MKKKIATRRGKTDVKVGFVKFPTKKSTGEGGAFVRLVVIDTKGDAAFMKRFVPCCGGYVSFQMDDCFMGDDLAASQEAALGPEPKGGRQLQRFITRFDKLRMEREQKYFPMFDDPDHRDRYLSRPFLAVILLGATGWSGHWRATFDDLTADGKALYRSVQKLYPGCELRLLTFLDT